MNCIVCGESTHEMIRYQNKQVPVCKAHNIPEGLYTPCKERSPVGHFCTLPVGHKGKHVAHGDGICKVWI